MKKGLMALVIITVIAISYYFLSDPISIGDEEGTAFEKQKQDKRADDSKAIEQSDTEKKAENIINGERESLRDSDNKEDDQKDLVEDKPQVANESLEEQEKIVVARNEASNNQEDKMQEDKYQEPKGQESMQPEKEAVEKGDESNSTTQEKDDVEDIKQDIAISEDQMNHVQNNLTLKDKAKAIKMIVSNLSASDIKLLKDLVAGGMTKEEKKEAIELAFSRYSEEELAIIQELYHKYMGE